jgi:hypothetical protein
MIEGIFGSMATLALLGMVGWLSRTWILTRLREAIRLETDSKLQTLRSDLQRANDSLQSITDAGQKAFSQVQIAQLPHRIEAIRSVWGSVIAWNPYSMVVTFVAVLPLDWVKKYGSDPKTKENFSILLGAPGHIEFLKQQNKVETVRPFLSERSWALYSAYNSFYLSRIMKAAMFLFPTFDHVELWKRADERALVVASAPEDIVRQYDTDSLLGGNAYLSHIKEELVKEFRAELSGTRHSDNAVTNTSTILKAANVLAESSKRQPPIPNDASLDIPT